MLTNHVWLVKDCIDDTVPSVGLIWNISILVLLNAIMYFSSSENIKGSILTLCLRLANAVKDGLLAKLCILLVPVLFFKPPSDLIKKFLS